MTSLLEMLYSSSVDWRGDTARSVKDELKAMLSSGDI